MQHENGQPGLLRVLSEAILGKRMVRVRYNGAALNLAPHQVFLRHGALYLGAFNPDKNWRGPEDYRLGNFNFAGLSAVELSETSFDAIPAYDGTPPNDGDQVLVSIEQAAA